MKKKTVGIISTVIVLSAIGSFLPDSDIDQSVETSDQLISTTYSISSTTNTTGEIKENSTTELDTTLVTPTIQSTKQETKKSTKKNNTTHKINNSDSVAKYNGKAYISLKSKPDFLKSDYTTTSFEYYSPLDSLGRCGVCFACIGRDIMPTEERGEIGPVKPTGWHTVRYDDLIADKYLYNRCHLIGYQLSGENANTRNLITGTRYLNVTGMLPFENKVANYVERTNNHVLYRVTPDFHGKELVARGVQIEALSVEDNGSGICFNVYCYNVQPGIIIDYSNGDSKRENEPANTTKNKTTTTTKKVEDKDCTYILNTNTKKFHYPSCSSVNQMKEKNKAKSNETREQLIAKGYSPCGNCHP